MNLGDGRMRYPKPWLVDEDGDMRVSLVLLVIAGVLAGCGRKPVPPTTEGAPKQAAEDFYKVDPATAGSISGTVRFNGKRPAPKVIDMSEDPACVQAHQGKVYDESLVVDAKGDVGNAFVYVKSGLEGKHFPVPSEAVTIDQRGCWFRPRVLGLQVGQELNIVNSDPVTHNIHPVARVNREWNHSQGAGDPPMERKFLQPEVMIPVKCNIHSWMHAYFGVLNHPYFAVSGDDGKFAIRNLPPGTYTITVWQEKLGTTEKQVTIGPAKSETVPFVFASAPSQ